MAAVGRRSLFALPLALPVVAAAAATTAGRKPTARWSEGVTAIFSEWVEVRPLAFEIDYAVGGSDGADQYIDAGRLLLRSDGSADPAGIEPTAETDPPDELAGDDRAMAWEG